MKILKVNLMRLGLAVLIVFGGSGNLNAKPVSIENAKKIAVNQLYHAPKLLKEKALSKDDIYVSKVFTFTKESKNVYYVINLSPEGWVIVASDDVSYPIIAYSLTGQFSENDHPPAFDEWMSNVTEEIFFAIENQLTPFPRTVDAWENFERPSGNLESLGVVSPLIETTWGQGGTRGEWWLPWFPSYGIHCPYERGFLDYWRVAPTGCVATAMAQVMKYWSWPKAPVGTHSYDPYWKCESQPWPIRCFGYGERSVNLNDRTYDWDIMPNVVERKIAGTHSPGEKAVQQLMSDIGIAVDMDYHPSGSGAYFDLSSRIRPYCSDDPYYTCWHSDALMALTTYFRYDVSADYKVRSGYSTPAWINLLKEELDNGRPVIYAGSNTGRHAFICDGYAIDPDIFHFNWGWNELFFPNLDGWFYLNDLTPGAYNFNADQDAIFNLKPKYRGAYTAVKPCRIVDTRKTTAGIIDAGMQRNFYVRGSGGTIAAQGGDPAGCPAPLGKPLAAHINMVAVNPTGKGNLQAFPVGARTGAGLSVNYNTIDTNLANAGTVKTALTVPVFTGSGPDITVASNFSSAHTVIDILGYYYPDEGLYYTPVDPCRIVDTRKTSAGVIGANLERDFRVYGSVGGQGGNTAGCPSPGGEPLAAHINMVAVAPAGKGNLQAFPVAVEAGAGLSVNYNTIDTNLANAGTVKAFTGSGPDITVASNFSSAHTVIDVLGYYSEEEDLLFTPVTPCRIVDTRKTSAGVIDADTERCFRVYGSVGSQGGNAGGCSSPLGQPLAAHINMVAVNPTGKGNLQAFPVGAGAGAGLSVNYNTIDTNLANAGTVKTVTGAGLDICVASNFSSAHTVIDVLGYYYPAP